MDGVLNINKPPGPTSHDIVAEVRHISGERRVGHAGTLDPLASGVLLVCLGNATRIVEYLMSWRKVYRTTAVFGASTDTEDAAGQIIEESDASYVTEDMLKRILDKFIGKISQTPPMVSAVRYKGRKLYELARRGQIVERAPKTVEIYSLKLIEFHPGMRPEAVLDVECSRGTYIRTLCADIGRELGCGGYMKSLVRTAVGWFTLENSVTLSFIEELASKGRLNKVLYPIDEVLKDMPAVVVQPSDIKRILNGVVVYVEEAIASVQEGSNVRIKSPDGSLLGIGKVFFLPDGRVQLKPSKVLAKVVDV
ncbi:MAG: tRNA pseudouridine(55) synthase TruB [Armatimonadota bacterium]|nr:tRNA pseudouridine(55) synthase TruB [Armatimonadota bacterium]